jgi:hypothetical protein
MNGTTPDPKGHGPKSGENPEKDLYGDPQFNPDPKISPEMREWLDELIGEKPAAKKK